MGIGKKKKKNFPRPTTFFFSRVIINTGLFLWPYVEPPSKSPTASNNLSSDDDAVEIKTSEIVQSIKSRTAGYPSIKRWLHLYDKTLSYTHE